MTIKSCQLFVWILLIALLCGVRFPQPLGASEPPRFDADLVKRLEGELCARYDAVLSRADSSNRMRVRTTDRFIIVTDASESYLAWLSELLERVAQAFDQFVETMEFEACELDSPLTVVLFATREEFDVMAAEIRGESYWQSESKPTGFYNARYNACFVYDRTGYSQEAPGISDSREESVGVGSRRRVNHFARALKERDNSETNVCTIVHETTHLLAYNYGFFSARRESPSWAIEGMAMLFEPSSGSATLGWRFGKTFPVNRPRLYDFKDGFESDPNLTMLPEVLFHDSFAQTLDDYGYATAWALFYYCYRKRTHELAEYLTILATRRYPAYSDEARREDFQACFGSLEQFQQDFRRFINRAQ
ncbi:MAG: DUF1570 domain-containing protein [Planctomycetia bacterium]|nr:DUF1570 domain-containing protein [Planctomycetia bacterium]